MNNWPADNLLSVDHYIVFISCTYISFHVLFLITEVYELSHKVNKKNLAFI